jgi:outer membrane protein assembly factor BamE (lipoprotein component of BamABCDE complex)
VELLGLMDRHPASQQDQRAEIQRPAGVPLLAVGACALYLCSLVGAVFLIVTPYAATRYAPGYSEKAYWSIRPGDAKADVLAKLGEPFFRYGHLVEEQWDYTKSALKNHGDKLTRSVAFDPANGKVSCLVADKWQDFFD